MISPLLKKINRKSAKVCVIGLGYVGLPLAIEFAKSGFVVTGIEVDKVKVKKLRQGQSYVDDVDAQEVEDLIRKGRLQATTDFRLLKEMDAVSICVPTPLRKTKDPDISYILAATREIKKHLHKNQLVVLESTTYPGTTDELVLPELKENGLKVGRDFFLAFSPERVDPGNKVYTTKNTPKVIGGVTPQCTEIAVALYQQAIEKVIPVSSTRSAEMVKLLENTFRAINIGLANEVAIMCDRLGINVWEVIEAAATKPFGFMPFYPGPGLGGHCIPIDPLYLSWKLKALNYNARFIELASEINTSMPYHVVNKVTDTLNRQKKSVNGSKILILGVAYKRDVEDVRESPALDIIELLKGKGAEVSYSDPHVPVLMLEDGKSLASVDLFFKPSPSAPSRVSPKTSEEFDCIIIVTNHSNFDYETVVDQGKLVVDTRNATRHVQHGRAKIVRL
jgi:UDP-N-acetyl-D-glucosamine dehydrogenase